MLKPNMPLILYYANGTRVTEDYARAAEWDRKAAYSLPVLFTATYEKDRREIIVAACGDCAMFLFSPLKCYGACGFYLL